MCTEPYICLNRGKGKGNIEKKYQHFKIFFHLQLEGHIKDKTTNSKIQKNLRKVNRLLLITYIEFFFSVFIDHFLFFINWCHFLSQFYCPTTWSFSCPVLVTIRFLCESCIYIMTLAILFSSSSDVAPELKLFALGSSINYGKVRPGDTEHSTLFCHSTVFR